MVALQFPVYRPSQSVTIGVLGDAHNAFRTDSATDMLAAREHVQAKDSAPPRVLSLARLAFVFLLSLATVVNAQNAEPSDPSQPNGRTSESSESVSKDEIPLRGGISPQATPASTICQMIASAAASNGLPFEFFARIIWQESRFRPDAVGPVTRSGHKAQGIAQFMPMTAAERLLRNPFDPAQALPKSAEFLRELRARFGNLGLAAAAYNAGPQRVRDWLAGKRALPSETQAYVRIVTGHSAEEWARPQPAVLSVSAPTELSCTDLDMRVAKLQPTAQPASAKAAGAQSASAKGAPEKVALPWGVQLIGDRSELNALSTYRQLQKRHDAILRGYEPVVIRTTIRGGTLAIWNRVRIETDTRQSADLLCSKLRAARETCLVQRN
jgi:soluble lytic murein transglycosylase-like protein